VAPTELARVRQSNKAHNGANRPENNEEIKERQNTKREAGVVRNNSKAHRDELKVKQE
jgi:hypothetical protein